MQPIFTEIDVAKINYSTFHITVKSVELVKLKAVQISYILKSHC